MKIKTLCTLILLMLSASLASAQGVTRCGGPSNALAINWPTFQFDVCHTGYNPYETLIGSAKVQNLALAWKYTTGNQMSGSPVLANGVVYFGSHDTKVYAANAHTGVLRWSYSTGDSVISTPAARNLPLSSE